MPEYHISSGNVFADLGLPDAAQLSVRSRLVIGLKQIMERYGLTEKEVADRLGADQPTISKVLSGQLDLVSLDRLVEWHAALEQDHR